MHALLPRYHAIFAMCMLAATLAQAQGALAETSHRPNVVILLADDMGSKDLGCDGGPVKTPAIDGLASGGTRFEQFYAACAVCSPTRASLLTGRHHIRSGVWSWIAEGDPPRLRDRKNHKEHLLEKEVTIAELLRSHGYATMHAGKWHLGLLGPKLGDGISKPTPADHGFDHWLATALNAHPSHRNPANFFRNGKPVGKLDGYSCQIVVDEAIRWLEDRKDKKQPFFLNLWFHEPHAPLAAPQNIVRKYGKGKGATYSGTIHNTDTAIRRLVKYLYKIAPPEDTLIIFVSDNGSYLPERNGKLKGRKGMNWEGGIRVPGIFYWPSKIKPQVVAEQFGSVLDILPTICDLVEIERPAGVHLDGTSLAPLLLGKETTLERSQPLFWHLYKSRPMVALRSGDFSLVADPDYELSTDNLFNEDDIPKIKKGGYKNYRLYNLKDDPSQTKDLASEQPDRLAKLKQQLLDLNANIMAEGHDWHQK